MNKTEPKPGKTRQAELETRKRAAGMVRFPVWTWPECVPAIKAHATAVTDDATALREHATKLAAKRAKKEGKT